MGCIARLLSRSYESQVRRQNQPQKPVLIKDSPGLSQGRLSPKGIEATFEPKQVFLKTLANSHEFSTLYQNIENGGFDVVRSFPYLMSHCNSEDLYSLFFEQQADYKFSLFDLACIQNNKRAINEIIKAFIENTDVLCDVKNKLKNKKYSSEILPICLVYAQSINPSLFKECKYEIFDKFIVGICLGNKVDVSNFLDDYPFLINVFIPNNKTPLDFAIENKQHEIAKLLEDRLLLNFLNVIHLGNIVGVNYYLNCYPFLIDSTTPNGKSPFDIALNQPAIKSILKNKLIAHFKTFICDENIDDANLYLDKYQEIAKQEAWFELTALLKNKLFYDFSNVIRSGKTEKVRNYLERYPFLIDYYNSNGKSSMHIVIECEHKKEKIEITRLLIDKGFKKQCGLVAVALDLGAFEIAWLLRMNGFGSNHEDDQRLSDHFIRKPIQDPVLTKKYKLKFA